MLSVGTQPVHPTREYRFEGYAETFSFVWIPRTCPLDASLWLAKTPLTRSQLAVIYAVQQKKDYSILRGPEAARFDVLYFMDQLTSHVRPMLKQLTGKHICLPKHREWVRACRAGTTSDFPFDRSDASIFCTYGRDVERFYATATTGNQRPNAWGLHDMCGGIEELAYDRHGNILACGGHSYSPLDQCTPESNRLILGDGGFTNGVSFMNYGMRLCLQEE